MAILIENLVEMMKMLNGKVGEIDTTDKSITAVVHGQNGSVMKCEFYPDKTSLQMAKNQNNEYKYVVYDQSEGEVETFKTFKEADDYYQQVKDWHNEQTHVDPDVDIKLAKVIKYAEFKETGPTTYELQDTELF